MRSRERSGTEPPLSARKQGVMCDGRAAGWSVCVRIVLSAIVGAFRACTR